MDADRFAALIHAIGAPRRTALGGALGAGTAALLTRLGVENAAANKKKRRRRRKKKKKKQTCSGSNRVCDGECVSLLTNGFNCGACGNACANREICLHGACFCQGQEGDCPAACLCIARREGGAACGSVGPSTQACTKDGDCPVGAFCLVLNKCSRPCLE